MHVEPALPRYQLERTPGGIRVAIPARRNWFVILFISVWLVAWAFGERSAIEQLTDPQKPSQGAFLFIWLIGWTLGGAWALLSVLWQMFGKEIIIVEHGVIVHSADILGIGRTRSYAANQVTRLRAVDYTSSMRSNQAAWKPPFFGAAAGPIAFDYGARSIRIAPSLDEAEARLLVPKLTERLPANVSEDRIDL
ncbi:MAG TPA: hypothetical protein VFG03_20860 [Telluria sp.]|nr:hypothetical protein [Telluria sp.]